MANLESTQLKDGFQTLVSIGTTTVGGHPSNPATGSLTNGKGTALTQVTLGLGSSSAPSYSFTGDVDTGMFSSGANVLNLATGGNNRMTIASSGNISIGTANSSAKLQVGTSSEEILRLERDTTTNDSFIDLTYASGHSNDSDANHEYSKIRTKVVANLSGQESSELHFQTINAGTMGTPIVIDQAGLVGIGSTSGGVPNPAYALEVQANSTSGVLAVQNHLNDANTFRSSNSGGTRTFDIGNNSSGHGIANIRNSSGAVKIQLLGSGDSYFNGGKVGIGGSPSQLLHLQKSGTPVFQITDTQASGKFFLTGVDTNNTFFRTDASILFQVGGTTERMKINGSSGDISFRDTGGNQAFYWDASTARLGLGTQTPNHQLEIYGGSGAGSYNLFRGFAFNGSTNKRVEINIDNTESDPIAIFNTTRSGGAVVGHSFQIDSSEKMRIESSGDIKFAGANSNTTVLSLNTTSGSDTKQLSLAGGGADSDGRGARFRLYGNNHASLAGDADLSTGNVSGAQMDIRAKDKITLHTNSNPSVTIDSSGKVGIGATTPSYPLEINTGAGTFSVRAKGGSSVSIASDASLTYFGNTHEFSNSAGTSEFMRIDSSGNLGIGTNTPNSNHKAHIEAGSGNNTSLLVTTKDNADTAQVIIGHDEGLQGGLQLISDKTNSIAKIRVTNSSLFPLSFQVRGSDGTNERMRIDPSGNVGIGTTTTTTAKLTVADSNGAGLEIIPQTSNDRTTLLSYDRNASTYQTLDLDSSDIHFNIAGSEVARINSSGNVGIGTTNPDEPLHVAKSSGDAIIAVEANAGNAALYLTSAGSGKDNRIVLGNAKDLKFEAQAAGSGQGQGQDPTATGTTIMTLTNTGNVLVGKNTADDGATTGIEQRSGGALYIAKNAPNLLLNRLTTDGDIIRIRKDGTTVGSIGVISGDVAMYSTTANHNGLRFALDAILPTNNAGSVVDNDADLGSGSYRFDDIFATNGTIQTSDRNEKQDIEELNDAELRVAQKAKTLLRKFRWTSSVEEKGDDARVHFGIIAQDLEQAFIDEGLDAGRYGMFIKSTWTNEDGEEQTRLGVRYNQLLAFIISTI